MAISILSPKYSFYQFGVIDAISGCGFSSVGTCLQVLEDNDVAFQFKIVTSTPAEADGLCGMTNSNLEVGIVNQCGDPFLMVFTQKTERYRINDNTILYNWSNGLPNFKSVIDVNECFHIKIRVNGTDTFCSNLLCRINDDCYTSVMDYNNNDDAFDFDYCGGTLVGDSSDVTCEPMFVTFSGQATLNIPYTTSLQDKYGPIPTIQTWINIGGELVDVGIRVSFDAFPPTLLKFDFGGVSDGVIKIS